MHVMEAFVRIRIWVGMHTGETGLGWERKRDSLFGPAVAVAVAAEAGSLYNHH